MPDAIGEEDYYVAEEENAAGAMDELFPEAGGDKADEVIYLAHLRDFC